MTIPEEFRIPDGQAEMVTYDGREYALVTVKCCREWQVTLGFHVGRCGYCGERPTREGT